MGIERDDIMYRQAAQDGSGVAYFVNFRDIKTGNVVLRVFGETDDECRERANWLADKMDGE